MNPALNPVVNEMLRRQMALQSIDDYANYMATSQHLDFLHAPAKHHRLITRAMDLLLTPLDAPEHPKDRWGDPVTKLLLTAPPGSAKSTYCTVQLPTYYLAKYPTRHVLCSSNVGDLAESFSRRRRSACMSQEWQNLSQTTLDPNASGIQRFYTLEGGSIMAAGAGKTIVGIRSNLNICDDPIESWEQAQSEGQLSKLWDWYEGEYRNRQHGIDGALEILMHQRWSRNDLAGVLLRMIDSGEERGWMVINLPTIIENESQLPDPVGRKMGERLWPENPAFQNKKLSELQRDPAKWAALYQQHPLDEEGGWVGPEYIQVITPKEWAERKKKEEFRYLAAGDLALSVNKGDWTVLIIAAVDYKRDLVITHMTRWRKSIEETVQKVYEISAEYPLTGWMFDDDNQTKVYTRFHYEYARSNQITPVSIDLMPMRGRDKEIRAAAIKGYFRSNRVTIVNEPTWAPDLIRAVLRFPGEPDDEVDTLGLIGRKIIQTSGIQVPKPPKSEPVQGLIIEKDGQNHLSLGLNTLFEDHERGQRKWNRLRIG